MEVGRKNINIWNAANIYGAKVLFVTKKLSVQSLMTINVSIHYQLYIINYDMFP